MKTLHAVNFRNVLQKVTMDYMIQFCQLNFIGDKIKTSIIAATRDIVIQHDLPNNVIGGLSPEDELTLSFVDPHLRIIPQIKALEAIELEDAEIEISDEKIRVLAGQWGGGTMHFCDDSVLANHIMRREPRELEYFHTIDVTPDIHFGFRPIKMIAPTYGKIYFSVVSGKLILETSDKTNMFTDKYILPLAEGLSSIEDLTVCFDFNHFNCLMNVMAEDPDQNYKMNFAWNSEEGRGMLYAHSTNLQEKYYLFSRSN
jgi:hypothetical protein